MAGYSQQPFKLNGPLDTRSHPGEMSPAALRWRQNFEVGKDNVMGRAEGFQKLLSGAGYGNQDLHDQLLPLQLYYGNLDPVDEDAAKVDAWPDARCLSELKLRTYGREYGTLLFEAVSSTGQRRLISATQSRVYELNEITQNHRLIGDGFGGIAVDDLSIRFRVAMGPQDTMVFTNNFDAPQSYKLDDNFTGCDIRGLKPIPSLDEIGLTRAAVVAMFKGYVLLADVVMDNQRLSQRIVWSDPFEPTKWNPIESQGAGHQDLEAGHQILRIEPFGDTIIVYTTRGMWQGNATGTKEQAFLFSKFYESRTGDKCLAYRNALCNTGDAHWFCAADGIYKIDAFSPQPELVEWLHKADGEVFRTINKDCCEPHCMGYQPELGLVRFSWARNGSQTPCLPSYEFVFHPKFEFAAYVDHGFTAYGTFRSDRSYSFRDLMRELCICTDTASGLGSAYRKEGLPPTNLATNTCGANNATVPVTPAVAREVIYTAETIEVADLEIENYWNDSELPDTGSLIDLLWETPPESFCVRCNEAQLTIGFSASDQCIKEFGGAYGREICTNPDSPGSVVDTFAYRPVEGFYYSAGYLSVARSGPYDGGDSDVKKNATFVIVDAQAENHPLLPAAIAFRLGSSFSPLDTNEGPGCDVKWSSLVAQTLRCSQRKSGAEYVTDHLAAAVGIEGPFYVVGNYLYYELLIGALVNPNDLKSALLPGVGGRCNLSTLKMSVMKLKS